MRTYSGLFDKITSFENLLDAARKAQQGKRRKPDVALFNFNLEGELLRLQSELRADAYRPGACRNFVVYESKRRLISAAPYRDRVVHHALCGVIAPLFEGSFISGSYANRKGFGTHKALMRASAFCRASRYVLQCDVRDYFGSIDRRLLLERVARRIRDERVLGLVSAILGLRPSNGGEKEAAEASGRAATGLPIGNLTSQFFANLYLDGLDHFIKEELRCKRYARYVDDFLLFDDDKGRLGFFRSRIEERLSGLRLRLHPRKTRIFPTSQGADFLGFKLFPTHRLLLRRNFFHFRRKLRRLSRSCRQGFWGCEKAKSSARSWIAHADWGDTWGLRRKLFEEALLWEKGGGRSEVGPWSTGASRLSERALGKEGGRFEDGNALKGTQRQ